MSKETYLTDMLKRLKEDLMLTQSIESDMFLTKRQFILHQSIATLIILAIGGFMINTLEKREDKELLQLKKEEIILDKLKTKQRCFERASLGLKNIPECLKMEVK